MSENGDLRNLCQGLEIERIKRNALMGQDAENINALLTLIEDMAGLVKKGEYDSAAGIGILSNRVASIRNFRKLAFPVAEVAAVPTGEAK